MVKHHLWKVIVAVALAATLVVPGVSATSTVFQSPPPGPPPNDSFYSATVITNLPFNDSVDMTYATTQENEPQYCNWSPQTAWYVFTASADGSYKVDLSGFYDGNLTVYQSYGPDITNLNYLNCASWDMPSITFNGYAGNTYYFQVGKLWGGSGMANLSVQLLPPPPNDNFVDAKVITGLPYDDNTDMTGATRETGEPAPSCGYMNKTIWYAYTPTESGSFSQQSDGPGYSIVAVYTGSSLSTLQQVACRSRYWYDSNFLTFQANAGTTYYFQLGTNDNTSIPFHLQVAPPPVPNFGYSPYDPSIFDAVNFNDWSNDPAGVGINSWSWDFGDGTIATGSYVDHRYAQDRDYTVTLTVTTPDGRTASISQTVRVKTHDVAITKFSAPQSASAGQTRQIVVGLNSKRYVDVVQVELFKSVPASQGVWWQWVGTLQQTVPVRPSNRTTEFTFNYTFTKDDASIGKVTFKAVASIVNARDALPADNEAIALPTKVGKK